jgi:hypothetical protein
MPVSCCCLIQAINGCTKPVVSKTADLSLVIGNNVLPASGTHPMRWKMYVETEDDSDVAQYIHCVTFTLTSEMTPLEKISQVRRGIVL